MTVKLYAANLTDTVDDTYVPLLVELLIVVGSWVHLVHSKDLILCSKGLLLHRAATFAEFSRSVEASCTAKISCMAHLQTPTHHPPTCVIFF